MNQALVKQPPLDLEELDETGPDFSGNTPSGAVPLFAPPVVATPAFASALFANEQQLREIRNALETLLRAGEADEVIDRLEAAIAALEDIGHPIAALCRAVRLDGIEIMGWANLARRMAQLDACGPRITAIGINISCQGHGFIDECGEANPYLETVFYSDNAFGFSAANRQALLTGYGDYDNEWQDTFVDIDETLSVSGMSELQAAVYRLETEFRRAPCENGADHDALFIGSAFLATRIHQAVRETVLTKGLPRPVTILVGSNESSPFFDAPVITADEYRQIAPQLVQVPHRPGAEKPAALTPPPAKPEKAPALLDQNAALVPQSGSALRRSVMARAVEDEPERPDAPPEKAPSLLDRLFRRR